MKEDILEQLIEDWLISRPGYFVKHNLRYRPNPNHPDYVSKKDSVNSDIDILSINGVESGIDRVCAVTCKSWQGGFRYSEWYPAFQAEATYNEKSPEFQKRERWKYFRELISDKWLESFINRIELETGQRDFEYIIAVTKFIGSVAQKTEIENCPQVLERFARKSSSIRIRILTLDDLIEEYQARILEASDTTLEVTDIGRLLQLMKAAGFIFQKA